MAQWGRQTGSSGRNFRNMGMYTGSKRTSEMAWAELMIRKISQRRAEP
jgi:hypothetical protein